MSQVCWDEVAEEVASNRYGSFYRKFIRGVLQEKLDQLYQDEFLLNDEADEEARLYVESKDQAQGHGAYGEFLAIG